MQVNMPHIKPSQADWYSIYRKKWKAESTYISHRLKYKTYVH